MMPPGSDRSSSRKSANASSTAAVGSTYGSSDPGAGAATGGVAGGETGVSGVGAAAGAGAGAGARAGATPAGAAGAVAGASGLVGAACAFAIRGASTSAVAATLLATQQAPAYCIECFISAYSPSAGRSLNAPPGCEESSGSDLRALLMFPCLLFVFPKWGAANRELASRSAHGLSVDNSTFSATRDASWARYERRETSRKRGAHSLLKRGSFVRLCTPR